jgi:hypothetical protein
MCDNCHQLETDIERYRKLLERSPNLLIIEISAFGSCWTSVTIPSRRVMGPASPTAAYPGCSAIPGQGTAARVSEAPRLPSTNLPFN